MCTQQKQLIDDDADAVDDFGAEYCEENSCGYYGACWTCPD